MGMSANKHAEADGMWVCRERQRHFMKLSCTFCSGPLSPQSRNLLLAGVSLGAGGEGGGGGAQMPDLDLAPMAPHKVAHVGFGPAIPKFALSVLPVPQKSTKQPPNQHTSDLPMLLRTLAPTPSDCSWLSTERVTFLEDTMLQSQKELF